MTYREKLQQTNPEDVCEYYVGGCCGCPSDHEWGRDAKCPGIINHHCDEETCAACWNREMPEEKKAEEPIELNINLEEEKKMMNLDPVIRDAVLNAISDSDIEDAVKDVFANHDYSDMIQRAVENYLYDNLEDIAEDIVDDAVRGYMEENL